MKYEKFAKFLLKYRLTLSLLGLFTGVGILTIVISHGLTASVPLEPEQGTQTNTKIVTDPAASQQKAVGFEQSQIRRYGDVATINAINQATSTTEVETALKNFLAPYGMTIQLSTVAPSSYVTQYDVYQLANATDLVQLKQYAALFIDEWAKYPKSWITYSGVKSVAIVKDLTVIGQRRAATPDPFGDAMYYDFTYSGDYAREVVHHEFNHLITYNVSGSYSPADATWNSFNTAGFNYGMGGATCYTSPTSNCFSVHPQQGFVTGYSTFGIEEDKAELYAYLLTSTYYHNLQTWLPTDSYLQKKVTYYEQYIAQHSPEMTGNYYDRVNQ